VQKAVKDILEGVYPTETGKIKKIYAVAEESAKYHAMSPRELAKQIQQLEDTMYEHARNLEFEEAALLRDELVHVKKVAVGGEGIE